MGTLPTLQVLLDNGTGTFPLDISAYVMAADGYQISRGRDDWQDAVVAGQMSLTLNNSDGRFTPGSTILGTPSPITVDQRIRVNETSGGTFSTGGFGLGGFGLGGFGLGGSGTSSTRFTGYVKSWPVAWPAVVSTFATVTITATDAQARAERRTLRSMLEEEILAHSPPAYYTLGEAQDSTTAGDTSGNQASPLTVTGTGAALAFGTDVGSDSTAVTFAGGQYLTDGATGNVASPTTFALACKFAGTVTPAAQSSLLEKSGYNIQMLPTGGIKGLGPSFGTLFSPNTYNDGVQHIAVLTQYLGTAHLIIDGLVVNSVATSAGSFPVPAALNVGGSNEPFIETFKGTISQVATFTGGLSPTDATSMYNVAIGAPETADARIARLASYAGLPIGILDASSVLVAIQGTAGASAQSAMQEVADAALGLVYISGGGEVTYHDGTRVPAKTVPDLTLTSQWVTPDVLPTVDDQRLTNYVEVTSGTGGVSVAQNQASQTAHGRYPESVTYLVQTDSQALDRANWIIANLAEPTPRFGTLTINLYGMMTAALAQTVLAALELDCWLRVVMLGSQNPGGTVADVIVQGWQETATAESWTITCNVVARSLWNAFIPDDPVFGIPDAASARVFI